MALTVLIVTVFVAVLADTVVTVRPNTELEQFLIDCRAMNRMIEDCEKALLQAEGHQPIIVNRVVVEPFWYNPIGLGIVVGIVAIVGYGIFSAIRYLRRKPK